MMFDQTIKSEEGLQSQVSGSVLLPGDALYEQVRRGWNLSIDQRPALILVADNAQDVVAGVRFARVQGLGVAVQSTGHGIHYPANDNLLIVTSRMASVHIDPQARTARVESGVIWQQVLDKAAEYGLAPLVGSSPHVGVVGYTLGGGIGWLARRYGLAANSVRSMDIVMADGVLQGASPTENSDLFWGLRGGGGSFGVVTAMTFDLYPVATVYGGSLVYPAALADETLRFFRDWIKTVPDELTSSLAIYKFPPLPRLPEAIRGKTLILLRAAFAGEAAEGEALMRAWLDWHPPISNTFHEMPFADIGTISDDPVDPMPGYGSSEMFNDLGDDTIGVIVRYATDTASPLTFVELRHAGGAMTQVAADTSAIVNQDAFLYMRIGAMAPTPEISAAIKAYVRRFKGDLQPYLQGGVYLNFMGGSEASARIGDAYPAETYERLIALKAKYDPENVFRFSYPFAAPLATPHRLAHGKGWRELRDGRNA